MLKYDTINMLKVHKHISRKLFVFIIDKQFFELLCAENSRGYGVYGYDKINKYLSSSRNRNL